MATAKLRQQRKSTLRRLAAKNFLSNISLDGTHSDTNYLFHVWKKHKHKPHNDFENKPEVTSLVSTKHKFGDQNISDTSQVSQFVGHPRVVENDVDNVSNSSSRPRASTMQIGEENKSQDTNAEDYSFSPDKNSKRWRASSCSGEKEKSGIRRRLTQLESVPSIRESNYAEKALSRYSSSVSGDSVESHDSSIRFMSPESHRRIKGNRVVIVTNCRTPFVVSSTLPYIKEVVGRAEVQDEVTPIITIHRSRHQSGTRSISSTEDMFLLGQKITRGDDAPDVSYSELLEPSKKCEMRRTSSDSKLGPTDTGTSLGGRVYTRSVSEDPHLYAARGSIVSSALDRVMEEEEHGSYDPNLLDDPELQSGGYRTVLNFSSYMTSVIDYVKPSTLKKELNEKFKDRFPHIQLTLTKFRSLKKEMRGIGHVRCNIDLWTVAQAYVFFEKLILKVHVGWIPDPHATYDGMLISKQNRKLCAGACLMLSAKLNDIKGLELSKLLDQIEDDFRLNRKEMLAYEFATLVALDFSLLIPDGDIYPHYQRLLYQS